MVPQLLQHLIAVAARLHVDEVHHDDPADVPQPQLARHFASRLEVRLEDRALGVLLAGITAGVHVDRGQRLGRSEEHTSELQSQSNLVCRLLLEKKKTSNTT